MATSNSLNKPESIASSPSCQIRGYHPLGRFKEDPMQILLRIHMTLAKYFLFPLRNHLWNYKLYYLHHPVL